MGSFAGDSKTSQNSVGLTSQQPFYAVECYLYNLQCLCSNKVFIVHAHVFPSVSCPNDSFKKEQ